MTNLPMTTFGGDGKAPIAERNLRPMTNEASVEDEKKSFEEITAELQAEVREMEDLPSAEEADLGELCQVPTNPQFEELELVDEDTPPLIGAITGGDEE